MMILRMRDPRILSDSTKLPTIYIVDDDPIFNKAVIAVRTKRLGLDSQAICLVLR